MKIYKRIVQSLILLSLCFLFLGTEKSFASEVALPKVSGLKQVRGDENSFRVEWLNVNDNNVKYEVALSYDGKNWAPGDVEQSYSNYMAFYGKNAGKAYYIKVRAIKKGDTSNINGAYSEVLTAVTAPANTVTNVKQTTQTETSVSLRWSAVSGATGYQISYVPYLASSSNPKIVNTTKTTYKISGLRKNTEYRVQIKPFNKKSSFVAINTKYNSKYVKPLPTKVTQPKNTSYYPTSNTAYFSCSRNPIAKGYHLQIYYGNTLVKSVYDTSYSYIKAQSAKLKSYNFFRFRVRAYIEVEGAKRFGAWSDWTYFAKQPDITSHKIGKGAIGIKWTPVKGATEYLVYVSTNAKTGYKKVKTTKSTSFTITKYGTSKLKAGKRYYYFVVANKKVGTKTYKGNLMYYWSSVCK